MSATSIFASATSTIHADLIIVGLRRVGISTAGISVLYPSYSRPDSVLYWLDGAARLELSLTGETVTVSGPLRTKLNEHPERGVLPSLVDSLRSLGLTEEQSRAYETSLLEDRVMLCIEAADDCELTLIFHILHHIGAEKIVIAETVATHSRDRAARLPASHAQERELARVGLVLSAA